MADSLQIRHIMRINYINHSYREIVESFNDGDSRKIFLNYTHQSNFVDTSIRKFNNITLKVADNILQANEDNHINILNYHTFCNIEILYLLKHKLKNNPTNRLIINYAKKLKAHNLIKIRDLFKAESENKFTLEIKSIYRAIGSRLVEECKRIVNVNNKIEVAYIPINESKFIQWELVNAKLIKEALSKEHVSLEESEELSLMFKNYRRITGMRFRQNQYRILHNKIFTNEKLHRFGLVESNSCCVCENVEDLNHLLFECPRANEAWNVSFEFLGFYPELTDIKLGTSNMMYNQIIALVNFELCRNRDKPINPITLRQKITNLTNDLNFIEATKNKRKGQTK